VNPEPYWEICTYDTCACDSVGDCTCFCDSVAAYAHVCAQKGVNVHWRSASLCPQSCEEKNKKGLEYACEWRFNSCGPACPVTCQHPEPVEECPLKCVEGCHANCPPGKILDEISESCVDARECQVCLVQGRRVPHGKRIILNKDDPKNCQLCLCEGNQLQCDVCELEKVTVPETIIPPEVPSPTPEVTDGTFYCNKMMDLAFLVDGSSKLSENKFNIVKDFIVGTMEKLHISQNKIRVSVVQYNSGTIMYFNLQNSKKPSELVKIVKGIKYTGSPSASTFEALKYASHYVFRKAPRDNAARIAMLLTASTSSRSVSSILKEITKHKITVIPVGLGPDVNMKEISLIESKSPMNKAFILDNVYELLDRRDEIIHYLCDLVPEAPKLFSIPTKKPSVITFPAEVEVTISPVQRRPVETDTPVLQLSTRAPQNKKVDLVIVIEGSDKVGEVNFNKSKVFLENMIQKMDISEETVQITIIQYSFTITIEYSFSQEQSKQHIIERIREIKYQGGNATNTGKALSYVSEHAFTTDIGSREQVPHLVYMVTSNPATDVITKVPDDIHVVPIAVGDNVDMREIELVSQHGETILIHNYDMLISNAPELVLEKCCSSSKPCTKPMDVIFILDGSSAVRASQFEEMKTFVKAFIKKADIEAVSAPYAKSHFEVMVYGVIMHEIRIPSVGFIFTFTPRNNEFTLQLNPSIFSSKTFGLCGICDQNTGNDFKLHDGSVTMDSNTFIKEWTVVDTLGRTCQTKLDDVCTQAVGSECKIMLSRTFEECHKVIPPSQYFAVCEEANCHGEDICEVIAAYGHICRIHGVCMDWRTSDFCAMQCPSPMLYDHCRRSCNKECANTTSGGLCAGPPTEGCYCADGDVMLNGKCVGEHVCSQCTDGDGAVHQHLDTWIPSNEPCEICMCLDNRMINCTSKPCSTITPITCGPCEVPRLKRTSDQCCPEYECACDLGTCELSPVPRCENGRVPTLTNPGRCKANYECACRKENSEKIRFLTAHLTESSQLEDPNAVMN
ncbi:hypothetical protein FKM82_011464, partial [Ascaphus truei]